MSVTAAAVTISTETLCLPWRTLKIFSLLPPAPSPLLLLHPPVIPWLAADSGFIPQKDLSLLPWLLVLERGKNTLAPTNYRSMPSLGVL